MASQVRESWKGSNLYVGGVNGRYVCIMESGGKSVYTRWRVMVVVVVVVVVDAIEKLHQVMLALTFLFP